jgi:hypothetical protein
MFGNIRNMPSASLNSDIAPHHPQTGSLGLYKQSLPTQALELFIWLVRAGGLSLCSRRLKPVGLLRLAYCKLSKFPNIGRMESKRNIFSARTHLKSPCRRPLRLMFAPVSSTPYNTKVLTATRIC